jgi:hypothetical protein
MATTAAPPRRPSKRLTDRQVAEFLETAHASDTVELKLTVPESEQRATILALGLDPLDAQIRMVYFFDTPDLQLEKAGIVVRARRIAGKGEDTVIKLRPVVPQELPDELRESPSFGVEVDAIPGHFVCSGSYKGIPRKVSVAAAAYGEAPLRKLFSKEQRAFYRDYAPADIALDDLTLLGPIFVLKVKGTPPGAGRKLVVELWLYPKGRILELSTKCGTHEAVEVAGETRAFLNARGVDLLGEQQTKTRTALSYFAVNPD